MSPGHRTLKGARVPEVAGRWGRPRVAGLLVVVLAVALMLGFPVSRARAETPAEPVVGQTATFHVTDWGELSAATVSAVVRYVGEHSVVYVEKGYPLPPDFASGLGSAFDTGVYPTLSALMGPPPDPGIDGQHRICILLYDFNAPRVMGMFVSGDIDPAGPSDPDSNRREMFTLNAAALAADPEKAAAISAHELAHLILYYRDYMLDPSPRRQYEGTAATWVEEGLAMYAELATGYGDRAREQLRSFELDPDKDLTSWGAYMNDYGASYAFATYLVDRFGPAVVRELVDQPLDGVEGIEAVLTARGAFDTFASLFDDWVIANFLDGHPPEVAPLYAYRSLSVAVEPRVADTPLPWATTGRVQDRAAVYFDAPPSDGTAAVRVVVDGEDGAPLHAALLSWDSTGVAAPAITIVSLSPPTAGGSAAGPAGYDRHTLVVWARGAQHAKREYSFRFSLASDRPGAIQFLDVGSDHDFYPYISTLTERGVVSGREVPVGSGLWYFASAENVMRAQFAKMVVEAVGLHTPLVESVDDPTFPDVVPAHDGAGRLVAYPFDYVEEAAVAGIVGGYGDGRFRPWDPLKRIQLVRMILRAAAAAGHPFPAYTGNEAVFADVPPGSDLYADAMTGFVNGILTGSIDDHGVRRLSPSSPATRGHVAKMTANLLAGLERAAVSSASAPGQ